MAITPEPDLDDPKEVYAFAGLALYEANLLESSLINLTTVLQLERVSAITRQVFDSVYEGFESKTLGQLLRAARGLTELQTSTPFWHRPSRNATFSLITSSDTTLAQSSTTSVGQR